MNHYQPEDRFTVQNLSCPMVLMRFYLVFRGSLPASSNSSRKPDIVRNIRDQFHSQMKFLWQSSAALKRLRQTAWVTKNPGKFMGVPESPLADLWDPETFPPDEEDWANLQL